MRSRILPADHAEAEILLNERQRIIVARMGGAAWIRSVLDGVGFEPAEVLGATKPYRFRCTQEQLAKMKTLGSKGMRKLIDEAVKLPVKRSRV